MNRFVVRALFVLALLLVVSLSAQATISITICPSSAPNAFGSPSFNQWRANALSALETGHCVDVGNRYVDPTGFNVLYFYYRPYDAIVTPFPAWLGQADPAAPFASELGNRLHFPVRFRGDGSEQFTLRDVHFDYHSSDGNTLVFVGDLSGTTLDGVNRVGVNFGPDRKPGTPDDEFYSSGEPDTTVLDALYYRGPGNGWVPDTVLDHQTEINTVIQYIVDNNVAIGCSFTVFGNTASVTLTLPPNTVFSDGFESGDTSQWGAVARRPLLSAEVSERITPQVNFRTSPAL